MEANIGVQTTLFIVLLILIELCSLKAIVVYGSLYTVRPY